MKKTLIYLDGGNDCLYSANRTQKEINEIKKAAKESAHIGFLSGYHYWNNETETVIVLCREKPSVFEIEQRRKNGLRAAKWYYL